LSELYHRVEDPFLKEKSEIFNGRVSFRGGRGEGRWIGRKGKGGAGEEREEKR
jgi:hypothetical protein